MSTVLPTGGLQLSGQGGDGLQTIAMTNTATAGGAIVHYAQGSDPQFIVPGEFAGNMREIKEYTSPESSTVVLYIF